MKKQRSDFPTHIPELKGWLVASQVAEALSLSRQRVSQLINDGVFKSVHRIGERPVFLVAESEVRKLAKTQGGQPWEAK